jgi:GrpB-like predicted nucleotidyltransferase (UPF0157 family)
MRKIEIVEYDKSWPELFQKEADLIREIFKDEIVKIYHIGSTSVPGLKAKPIIDIMPVVKNIENIDKYNEKMKSLRYEPKGEYGIKGRRFFMKGGADRTHHVHMFQLNNTEAIDRHLAVRDYLRTHKKEAEKYAEIKSKAAEKYPNDINGYCDYKDKFVKDLEKKALKWKNTTAQVDST